MYLRCIHFLYKVHSFITVNFHKINTKRYTTVESSTKNKKNVLLYFLIRKI